MAKLSARGATVTARYETLDGRAQYAVRSDGKVLVKRKLYNGHWTGWKTYALPMPGRRQDLRVI